MHLSLFWKRESHTKSQEIQCLVIAHVLVSRCRYTAIFSCHDSSKAAFCVSHYKIFYSIHKTFFFLTKHLKDTIAKYNQFAIYDCSAWIWEVTTIQTLEDILNEYFKIKMTEKLTVLQRKPRFFYMKASQKWSDDG